MSGLERVRCAVTAAATGSRWWALAASTQRATPTRQVDHTDFYGLAGEVVATLQTLEDLADTLARQSAGYGQGRALRDDAGADPMQRLEDAGVSAQHTRIVLAVARQHANEFWSAIGHISLAHTHAPDHPSPDAGSDDTEPPVPPGEGGGS